MSKLSASSIGLPGKNRISSRMDTPPDAPGFTKAQHEAEVRARLIEHHISLNNFARYLTGNRDQADDLVQDAMVRALSAAETFTPGTNFRGWIFMIARNLFYTSRRKPPVSYTPLHEFLHEPSVPASQEQNLEFCDFRRAYWEINGDRRDALILVGVSGLSYEKAALVTGCAVGTVKSRVSRARRDLKVLLSDGKIALPRRAVPPMAGTHLVEALEA